MDIFDDVSTEVFAIVNALWHLVACSYSCGYSQSGKGQIHIKIYLEYFNICKDL